MRYFYEDIFGPLPAVLVFGFLAFLWACGWYAKAHPVLGLAVAGIAFAVLPVLGMVVHLGLVVTLGLVADALFNANLAELIVVAADILVVLGIFLLYVRSARETRHMRAEHSIPSAPCSSIIAHSPTTRRIGMRR